MGQLVLTTLALVLATMPGPSPAEGPPVLSEANPPWAIPSPPPSPRGRLRPSPTSATPVLATLVLATLVLDTATLVPTTTASLLPASTPPTSPSLAGDSTKQTST